MLPIRKRRGLRVLVPVAAVAVASLLLLGLLLMEVSRGPSTAPRAPSAAKPEGEGRGGISAEVRKAVVEETVVLEEAISGFRFVLLRRSNETLLPFVCPSDGAECCLAFRVWVDNFDVFFLVKSYGAEARPSRGLLGPSTRLDMPRLEPHSTSRPSPTPLDAAIRSQYLSGSRWNSSSTTTEPLPLSLPRIPFTHSSRLTTLTEPPVSTTHSPVLVTVA